MQQTSPYTIYKSIIAKPSRAKNKTTLPEYTDIFFQLFYFWKFRKFNKLYVLKTQMLNVTFSLFFAVFQLSNSFLILGKDTLDFNHILSRLFMTLIFTFSLISLLVFIEVRKRTVEELKTQIFV